MIVSGVPFGLDKKLEDSSYWLLDTIDTRYCCCWLQVTGFPLNFEET